MIRGTYPGLPVNQDTFLSLQNNWVAYAASPAPQPKALLSTRTLVTFRGRIKSGTKANGTVICTLPDDFRPAAEINMAATGRGTLGDTITYRLQVKPNGDVLIFGVVAALGALTLDYISLDGLTYMVI